MPENRAKAGGCPERAWHWKKGDGRPAGGLAGTRPCGCAPPHAAAFGLAGSGKGVTSARKGRSTEGDATAARSGARESNQNQLKTELLFQGLPEEGVSSGRSWGCLFTQGRSPPHCSSLWGGVGRLRVGFGEKGSPRVHCASSPVLARAALPTGHCPSADVEGEKGSKAGRPGPKRLTHRRPY